ncbi:MAG TPA: iron-sulfur cluster assembly scaffold protein [Thermomicrobiales bacterium]|jgi:nitrogen fixation NifU-like protein|nr:iron-sulfur cluster assembly scaffold protein [Thermomicrobiales bacterium]
MDRQQYIEYILDHHDNPRNKGRLDPADIQLGGGNPGCGDLITMYLRFDENDRITDIRYEGEGCTISQAGGSIIAELAEGLTAAEVAELGTHTMNEEMGAEVVKSRVRCATLALGTLQAAAKLYMTNKERVAQGLPPVDVPSGQFAVEV